MNPKAPDFVPTYSINTPAAQVPQVKPEFKDSSLNTPPEVLSRSNSFGHSYPTTDPFSFSTQFEILAEESPTKLNGSKKFIPKPSTPIKSPVAEEEETSSSIELQNVSDASVEMNKTTFDNEEFVKKLLESEDEDEAANDSGQ